ncbi:hypothetical protein [Streptomyces kaniharaensis]|uniref:hypothetical protein n=1 Tax=Streptomyces kaniharaensis TaxID=212423 RepID=UPI0012967F79|nr:hypothetical protein [Streptomyces kaniharaensis]
MSRSAIALIFAGLFLLGGVISFWKQKLPKGVILVLGLGSGMCLAAGIMRL